MSAPLLLAALVTGLIVSVFQAATQINEMTLSFIPKLLAIFAVAALAGPWMLGLLVDFTRRLYTAIPGMIGEARTLRGPGRADRNGAAVIQITTAQWYAWISAFIFPFLRILGLVLADPVSGNRSVPIAAKVGLATFVTLVLAPVLPPIPPVDPASAAGVLIAVQQLAIGLAMGFAVRIALTAAELAGQLAGLQMGLGLRVLRPAQQRADSGRRSVRRPVRDPRIPRDERPRARAGHPGGELSRVAGGAGAARPDGLAAAGGVGRGDFTAGLIISLPVVAAVLIANLAVGS